MDVPYGFDCYAFSPFEMQRFEPNLQRVRQSLVLGPQLNITRDQAHRGFLESGVPRYIRFTRKNEDYSREQLQILTQAGRLNNAQQLESSNKQIFCGTKIQLAIGIVTNFLQMGLQYRRPIKGRPVIVNGSWRGIVSGLTENADKASSYDMAFGNFLAYDEEFPDMKFGPFYAIESKLVLLTGSARRIEASSFGTNINFQLWLIVLALMFILALLASLLIHWQQEKYRILDEATRVLMKRLQINATLEVIFEDHSSQGRLGGVGHLMSNFFFIYFTMLLNKPSIEFDDLIWPRFTRNVFKHLKNNKPTHSAQNDSDESSHDRFVDELKKLNGVHGGENNNQLLMHYHELVHNSNRPWRRMIPGSIRAISYIWSASCFIMASIYSGEMLAVILLHTDQNIDTINQLISAQPPIEPVIRQDDFIYNLMLKSLDVNMLKLHNMTNFIDRREVYSRKFIESVSKREKALLGDDELIETIYDIYSHEFPLYRSKTTYLQYPISIMYRKDLSLPLELQLRRGLVQIFEMGLLHRWNQAQKETLFNFIDKENKRETQGQQNNNNNNTNSDETSELWNSEQKYKPLSVSHFKSLFKLILFIILVAFIILLWEIIFFHLFDGNARPRVYRKKSKESDVIKNKGLNQTTTP